MTQPGPATGARTPEAAASDEVPDVAQALARLDGLDSMPTAAHVDAFDGVHRLLQDALATVDGA